MLDPRQLHALLAVARHGSFSRAAVAQQVTQPALSIAIARLERRLGVQLLDRTPRGARLTGFGKILARHARALEATLQDAEEEIRLHQIGVQGPLSIGGTPVSLISLVPTALGRLERSGVRFSAHIMAGTDEELLRRLRADELDIVVSTVGADGEREDLAEERLVEVPFDVVVRPGHALARRRLVRLCDLRDLPWAMPVAEHPFRRQIENIFLSEGERLPTNTVTCDTLLSLKAVASQTDCIAILPRQAIAVERDAGWLRAIRFAHSSANPFIGFIIRRAREPRPLLQSYIAALRTVAATAPASTARSAPPAPRPG